MTLAEIWSIIAWVAAAVVLISNAIEKIVKLVKTAKAPNAQQDTRLDKLEKRMDAAEKKLDNDMQHLESIDESNRVTQVALLALLDHGIDGNNTKQMQHAKEELQHHLINR
jgi:hypothetical protein